MAQIGMMEVWQFLIFLSDLKAKINGCHVYEDLVLVYM